MLYDRVVRFSSVALDDTGGIVDVGIGELLSKTALWCKNLIVVWRNF